MLMKFEFSQQILRKYSTIKFHENPSSPHGRREKWRDVTNLIVTFRNFANMPENCEKPVRKINIIIARALPLDQNFSVERRHNKFLVLILFYDPLLNHAFTTNGWLTE
jgi:hypothetical protein